MHKLKLAELIALAIAALVNAVKAIIRFIDEYAKPKSSVNTA